MLVFMVNNVGVGNSLFLLLFCCLLIGALLGVFAVG